MSRKELHRRKREREREHWEKEWKPNYELFMRFYPFTLEDLNGEIWKVIPDYEDYRCSNFGRVKSLKKGKVKILKPMLDTSGYLIVELTKKSKGKIFKIARLVAELFLANPFNKPQVNHLHGRWNNYYGCLEWATSSENVQHAYDTGLMVAVKSEDAPKAKLTAEQVLYIRNNPDNLNTYRLAEIFGVTTTLISLIQLGKIWKGAGGAIREPKQKERVYLSEKQREELRILHKTGKYTYKQLGEMFGVTNVTARNIVNGK